LKKDAIEISTPLYITLSLMHCFDKIGYTNYHKQEFKELGEVILLTAYGPKTTYLDGQTDLIKVLSIDFRTY